MSTHDEWEELAAAHALGALEPDDEQRFEAHLASCDICPQVLADTEAVMADLAYATEQVAPPPELKTRLMAAIHDASAGPAMGVVSSPDTLEVIRTKRAGRHTRDKLVVNWVRLAAAASVVLLAIIAGGVWSLHGSNQNTPSFVALQSPTGSTDLATVEVLGDKAWVINSAMPANDSSNSQYVLWTVPPKGAGAPTAVGGFDVAPGHQVVSVGKITQPNGHIAAFAVSKEPGRRVPTAPTVVVASGAVK